MPTCHNCGHEFGRRGKDGICVNCEAPITKEGKKLPTCPNCKKALHGSGISKCPHCGANITLTRVRENNLSVLKYVEVRPTIEVEEEVKMRKNKIIERVDSNTYRITYRIGHMQIRCPNCNKTQYEVPRVMGGKTSFRNVCMGCEKTLIHVFDI